MIVSTCLSVESFFQKANWQGFKLVNDSEKVLTKEVVVVPQELNPSIHLALTVESFFSLHNWQGILKTNEVLLGDDRELLSQTTQPIYSLTMSVSDFFQGITWEGRNQHITKTANIASSPKISNVVNITPKSLNINDLSDLF